MMKIYKSLSLFLFLGVIAFKGLAQNSASAPGQDLGDHKTFAMVGYGTLNYESSNGDSGFVSATFNPILLYRVNKKLSFNAELEVEVQDSWDGAFALEFAEFNYQLNNNLAIYGGKFLSPLGAFQSRLHPAWINKSFNNPIGIQNEVNGIKRLQGDSELGIGLRGGLNEGGIRLNYDVYTTNGPIINDDGSVDYDNAGGDNNNSPAIGGRIGILPFQNSTFELGLSAYTGKAGNKDAYSNAKVNLFVVDVNYKLPTEAGIFDLRGQFNDQKVSHEVYPETPVPNESFNNNTMASYLQLAYRFPNSKFELVDRIANLNVPNEVSWGKDQTRNTIGLDYWVNWNAAFKLGYDIINNDDNVLGVSFVMGL